MFVRHKPGPGWNPLGDSGQSLFEMALDALPDGVLLVDESRRVVYANPAFTELWQIPSELLATRSDKTILAFVHSQLLDPDRFSSEVDRLHSSPETSQDEIELKDGRILSRRSVPLERTEGRYGRIWIFSDITIARNADLDPLTGVANRRAYMRDFPAFVAAPANGLVRGVAIMDVDNFKSYNDVYGHAAGDEILQEIGKLLQTELHHADDLLFRIGGEEFLMAIHARDVNGVLSTFGRICRSLAAMKRNHEGNPPHQVVSASLGVGTFQGARDSRSVFNEVDRALYQAKRDGRNRLVHVAL